MNQEKMPINQSNELPPVDAQLTSAHNEIQASKQVERGTINSSTSPSTDPLDPPIGSQQNISTPQQGNQISSSQPRAHVSTPTIADDEDLIEKEWIESAKRIVAQTKGDPHAQSEEISAIKDDYKKKRFSIDNDLGKAS